MAFELIGSKTRRVEVGRSFIAPKDSNVLHTANYSHEPKFNGKKGTMEIRQGSVTMTIPGSGGHSQTFKGTKTGHTNKAVLIINKKTGKIVLERIGINVNLQLQSPPITFGQAYDRLKDSSSSEKTNIQPTNEKTVEPNLSENKKDHLKNIPSKFSTIKNPMIPTAVVPGPSNKDGTISLERKVTQSIRQLQKTKLEDSFADDADLKDSSSSTMSEYANIKATNDKTMEAEKTNPTIKAKLVTLFGDSPDVSPVSESSVKKLFTIEEDLQLTSDSDEETSSTKSVPRHVEGTRTESEVDNGPKLPPVNAGSVLVDDLDLSDSSDSESESSDSSSSDSE